MSGAAADRNLLLGIIALQMDFISRDTLIAAMHAWVLNKAAPLSQILQDQGDLTDSRRSLLDALVEEHLKLHQNEPQKSLAALGSIGSVREQLSRIADPDVQASLPRLAAARQGLDNDSAESVTATIVGDSTSAGTRFHIIRPHARGGLGEVFVARDTELNRDVALKEIQVQFAFDPRYRSRFEFEAEVTGGLEHPGIVPVYGLGAYADGRPYYAMRFIKGDSLKEAIDRFHAGTSATGDPGRRSLELRRLLRSFTDVCNAIEYAHSRGVLHRDIKPGNIIVGRHGETLVVDWGLAKATGKSDPSAVERTLLPFPASGSSETLPGSALGTPAYMSPEQAEGNLEALGPRSDVYSLGATLYCLLTGRPPVVGDDLGAILRAVQSGALVPPRQVDPSIDRALEAVCMKAMALRPDDRYGSCRALAGDVERWMADEPVSAWREPFSGRARRWARRNRTKVTAAAVALLAGVAGLVAVAGVQARANSHLRAANSEVSRANSELADEKARVQERYNLAMAAIKTFHTGVSEDFLLKEEKFKDLRDRLLNSASDFYGKLAALLKDRSDRASRQAMLQANFELAALTSRVGRKEDALAMHERVLAGREALAGEPGADVSAKVDVARSLLAVGRILEATGKTDEALAAYERARTAVADRAGGAPKEEKARDALAAAEHRVGWLLKTMGKPAEALAALERARDLQADLAAAHPENNEFQSERASTINTIGVVLSETRKPAEALAAYESALAINQKLAEAKPVVTAFQGRLANSYNNIGAMLSGMRKLAEALAAYKSALAIRQKLAEANPAVTEFKSGLADSHNNIGMLLSEMGKPAEALAAYKSALAIRQKLAEANPAVTEFQSDLATSHNDIGRLLFQTGKPAEALAAYASARAIRQKLAEANPAVTGFQRDLAVIHNFIGYLLISTGKPAEALAAFEAARAILQKLAEANPAVTEFQSNLAYSQTMVGAALSQTGNPAEAMASYEAAQAIYRKLVDANPSVAEFQSFLAYSQDHIGDQLLEAGKMAEALAAHGKALAIRQQLATASPKVFDYQRCLGISLSNVGRVRSAMGQLPEAIAACGRAVVIHERQINDNPTVIDYQSDLAFSLSRLGRAQRLAGLHAESAASLRRAVALFDRITSLEIDSRYELAVDHALLAVLAGLPGSGLSAAVGPAETDRAMDALRWAVAGGFRGASKLCNETALDSLRDRPDFKLLMMDLAMPPDP
ncbi:MAG: tetratricopeptide repeat protein, partial [Isosphaeraceae bacterium]